MNTWQDIIGLWPTIAAFGRAIDVDDVHARAMYRRNRVADLYFDRIVKAAHAIDHPEVTHELLCKIAALRPLQKAGGA